VRLAGALALSTTAGGYARAVFDLGTTPWRIYSRHILSSIGSTLVVVMTLNFPEVILPKSGLSFPMLGIHSLITSLGNMVGYTSDYIQSAPWILLAANVAIVNTTLSISVLGDWMHNRLDATLLGSWLNVCIRASEPQYNAQDHKQSYW